MCIPYLLIQILGTDIVFLNLYLLHVISTSEMDIISCELMCRINFQVDFIQMTHGNKKLCSWVLNFHIYYVYFPYPNLTNRCTKWYYLELTRDAPGTYFQNIVFKVSHRIVIYRLQLVTCFHDEYRKFHSPSKCFCP